VLFVGEAPGQSEDVLQRPFVGPAGKLMDRIIKRAGLQAGDFALTNLIACIPKDENNDKVSQPPKFAIEACSPRFQECVELVQPELIVWVGDEANKYGPKQLVQYATTHNPLTTHILHPGAIIRLHISQQAMAVKRCVVGVQDAWNFLRSQQ
jgi:uracil-DNA glycosylase family 4